MSLSPGTRLGAYEILSLLGAGGMGEVYRARDAKLNREVAVKILPDLLASDPDRLARFRREAQIVASLNHPNIAHIYELEDAAAGAGGSPVHALVMELVDGATLAERIAEGPLAIADALAVATQVAEALEAAHEQGIVHRDLKPANIKVRTDGVVKVLDFGLAKMFESGAAASGTSANLSISPTLSVHATLSGLILGTAAYMSPEQARGRTVDRRTDVWAFGCVLFEMLAGARAFGGEDIAEIIGAVIHKEPEWQKLPTATPATVRVVLRTCLEKDPKRRLRDIGDVQLALGGAFETATAAAAAVPVPTRTNLRSLAIAAAAGATIAGVIGATATWLLRPSAAPRRPTRFTIAPPSTQPLNLQGFFRQIAISPTGAHVAYIAGGEAQLMVRAIDQIEAVPLRGAIGAGFPFFSPDGKWIGYMTGGPGEIRKVALTGGPPIRVCDYAGTPRGATWSRDDTIVYATNELTTGLMAVPATGGESRPLTQLDRAQGELDHWMPSFSPDGRIVFFTISSVGGPESGQIAALDLQTGTRKAIVRGGTDAVYVAASGSGNGYLVYGFNGTLRAVRFDLNRMTTMGEPTPVADQVAMMQTGATDFSVSGDGTLIFVPGGSSIGVARPLAWVARNGREELVNAPPRAYTFARLSPDETRLALAATDQENDVWIYELRRGTMTRLTSDPATDGQPVWSPDGRRIVFVSNRNGPSNLYSQAADGTGAVQRLTTSPTAQAIGSFLPDGRSLVLHEGGAVTSSSGADLMLLRLDSPPRTEPLLRTPFFEAAADISPNGRWLAYYSTESGRPEVYVRPFPNVNAGLWQISPSGGSRPVWSKDGNELFYLDATTAMMSVPVQTGATFKPGTPVQLFPGPWYSVQSVRPYDVSRNGKFLMIKTPGSDDPRLASPTITVVMGWSGELKARVPEK